METMKLFFKLTDAYLDSPTTLYMTLELLDKLGHNNLTILGHKNSAEIIGQVKMRETTSYYTFVME